MAALQHEHRLTLVDLNPKYPHDEEVYDDEEDLIIKQAFKHPCDRCKHEITYLHRYYYKCDQCDYSLHKLCVELPTTLEHASHIAHTLTLFLDESLGHCHMCQTIPLNKQLCYHCSQCTYNICLNCGIFSLECHTIYHPSHQHPLFSIRRQILANCHACGKEHKGIFYLCTTCFLSFIHSDCAFRQKRMLIQDGTCDRFFHTHQLILAYSFSKVEQQAKQNPRCRVCDNFFSDSENLWVYKCDKCRYYVHFDCAYLRDKSSEPFKSGLRINSKNYEEHPNVHHLPLSDKTYNMIKEVVYKETNETSIIHFSHEHPLVLVDSLCDDITSPDDKNDFLCNACTIQIVKNMSFYKCMYGCNFVLHDWCTRLPVKLKNYKNHTQHTLSLLPKACNYILGDFYCDVCHYLSNGFAYSCVKCSYYIDVRCAFIPELLMTHKAHPYHRFSKKISGVDRDDYCRLCLSSISREDSRNISFSCLDCRFYLHIGCALLLPETIKVKYDKHPMKLSYGPIENYVGDYFCEACEEELNPNAAFYHCVECVQSVHIECAPLIPSTKAYLNGALWVDDYGIKFGGVHKLDDHPHPVSYKKWSRSDGVGRCNKCRLRIYALDPCLKCRECNFAIHKRCIY